VVGTFLKPSCGRRDKPIHSIPYSVALPLERGFNNYYFIIQGLTYSFSKIKSDGSTILKLYYDHNVNAVTYGYSNEMDATPPALPEAGTFVMAIR